MNVVARFHSAELKMHMKWPKSKSVRSGFTTSIIIIAMILLVLSCHTKKSVVEESMTLNEWLSMNLDTRDTLYLPWQLWASDTTLPLTVVRHKTATFNGCTNTELHDTTKKVTFLSKNTNNCNTQNSRFLGYGFGLLIGFISFFLIVVAIRRI